MTRCVPPADGSLYSATVADFQASDAVIYRSLSPGQAPLRTLKYSSRWLQGTPERGRGWGGLWGGMGVQGCRRDGVGVTGVGGCGRVMRGGGRGCRAAIGGYRAIEGGRMQGRAEHEAVGQGQEVAGSDGPSDLPCPPEPHFVQVLPYGPYVYFFFREVAVELSALGKVGAGTGGTGGAPRGPPLWSRGRGHS